MAREQNDFIKQTGMKRQYNRESVDGFSRSEAAKARSASKKLLTNASGKPIIKVKASEVKLNSEPNTITQTENRKGGVNRNYYDGTGKQIKQVSNNHHGHKAVQEYGNNGEHAHDYIYGDEGELLKRPHRELTDGERKENEDIL